MISRSTGVPIFRGIMRLLLLSRGLCSPQTPAAYMRRASTGSMRAAFHAG